MTEETKGFKDQIRSKPTDSPMTGSKTATDWAGPIGTPIPAQGGKVIHREEPASVRSRRESHLGQLDIFHLD